MVCCYEGTNNFSISRCGSCPAQLMLYQIGKGLPVIGKRNLFRWNVQKNAWQENRFPAPMFFSDSFFLFFLFRLSLSLFFSLFFFVRIVFDTPKRNMESILLASIRSVFQQGFQKWKSNKVDFENYMKNVDELINYPFSFFFVAMNARIIINFSTTWVKSNRKIIFVNLFFRSWTL